MQTPYSGFMSEVFLPEPCPEIYGSIFSCHSLLDIMSKSFPYSVVSGESSSCPLISPQSKASSTSISGVTFMCRRCFT